MRAVLGLAARPAIRQIPDGLPLVAGRLTGDTFEVFQRKHLDAQRLADWAVALLTEGFESEAIIRAAGGAEMHWQDVTPTFIAICRELEISNDVEHEIGSLTRAIMIEEYRRGVRTGADLLHRFDDLRREVKFPGQVVLRILADNEDGTNHSGYYDWEYRLRGDDLEAQIRGYLQRAGICMTAPDGLPVVKSMMP